MYGANLDAPEHCAAREFLVGVGRHREPWYVSDGILYEFLRVATHPKVFPQPLTWSEAMEFLSPFIEADTVRILRAEDRHWTILAARPSNGGCD